MKYVIVAGGKPLNAKQAEVVEPILEEAGTFLTSGARNQAAVEFARSLGYTLSSQAELYDCWQRRVPGCNPANPPGRSTHEGKNDGVAYRWWPAFFSLPWWAWGLDLADSADFVQSANAHGFRAAITYPGDPREGHHVNLRKKPSRRAWRWVRTKQFRVLRKGSRGRAVGAMTKRLVYLGWLDGNPSGNFNERVEDALASFQRHYSQQADGVYGPSTDHQLKVAVRGRKACRKQAMRIDNKRRRDEALERCSRRFGPARDERKKGR
jgi:hypothetical protein